MIKCSILGYPCPYRLTSGECIEHKGKCGYQKREAYTKEELKYYFQTMKEKYKNTPAAWCFRSVEISMFDDDDFRNNIDTILKRR